MSRTPVRSVFLPALLFASSAFAHDSWVNRGAFKNGAGEWCCGDYDCKSYTRISSTASGWMIDGDSFPTMKRWLHRPMVRSRYAGDPTDRGAAYRSEARTVGALRSTRRRASFRRGGDFIQILGSGRPPDCFDGTFTQASPSSTTSSATEHLHVKRARNFSGISSATATLTSTVSPILTGARKFKVCEI